MSNQKAVCQIFNLSPNEKIFDDFGCSFSDKIMYPGRMFITENYICFNSSIMGLNKNIKIKIKEIIDIVLNKYLMKTWIEITTTEKINNSGKLSFTSFNNAELVLKKILKIKKHLDKRLGKLNNKGLSSSEESEEDVIIDKRNTISYNISNSMRNSNSNNSHLFSTNTSVNNANTSKSIKEENTINNDSYYFESFKDEKKEYFSMDNEQNYLHMLDTEKFNELPLIVVNINVNDAFRKIYVDKGKLSNFDFTKESPIKSNIVFSKWFSHIDNNEDYIITLKKLMEKKNSEDIKNLDCNEKESLVEENNKTNLIEINPDLNKSTTLVQEVRNNSNLVINGNNIEVNKDDSFEINLNLKDLTFPIIRQFTFDLQMKNIPFVNSSNIIKSEKIEVKKSGFVYFASSVSLGVPYSDYFTLDEYFEFYPILNLSGLEYTIIRNYFTINFVKSTMFKSTILQRTKEEYFKNIGLWKEYLVSNGIEILNYSSFKSKNSKKISLNHELVSDNYNPYEIKEVFLKESRLKLFYQSFTMVIRDIANKVMSNISWKDISILFLIIIILYYNYVILNKLDKIELANNINSYHNNK